MATPTPAGIRDALLKKMVLEALASGRLEETISLEVRPYHRPQTPIEPIEWDADVREQISQFAQQHNRSFEDAVASLVALADLVQSDRLHREQKFREKLEENQRIREEQQRERRNAARRARRRGY